MAEEIYNLKFTGEETDEILESAKNVKEANLTTLNDISGFVCIDKNGNAIGMMSKKQVASVVGGLIGEANYAKTGMMGKNYCMRKLVDNGGAGKYYMFKIPRFRAYASYEILATTDDGRMLWCVFTFSPYNGNPIKPALIKNKEFYGAIKFFRKEGENNSNYFQLYTGSNATSLFIRCVTANFDVNAVESSNESAESLIEIPMS